MGFTIVELMLGVVTMAIVVLAVGSLFYYAWMGWARNTHSVAMQRDAYLAMDQIAREIRNSNPDEVSWDVNGIYFTPAGSRTNDVDILASDIAYSPKVNITGFEVGQGGAENNEFTVSFTLFTDNDTDRNDYSITVTARNEAP